MMLGNLLGHIDALLSDGLEVTENGMDEQGNDKRKGTPPHLNLVTFSEAIMEKTISATTSTTVSGVGK
jgi:hypothetical protein